MNDDAILEQCTAMSDLELIRAMTVDRADYADRFHAAATEELARRGVTLEELRRRASVRSSRGDQGERTIDAIVEGLRAPRSIWDAWAITSSAGDTLVIQPAGDLVTAHHFTVDGYAGSTIFDSPDVLERAVRAFVALEPWMEDSELDASSLDAWTAIAESNRQEVIESMAQPLLRAGLPFVVRDSRQTSFNAIFGTQYSGDAITLLLPNGALRAAKEAIEANEREIETLRRKLAAVDDDAERLEILDQLAALVRHDPALFLEQGVLLRASGRHLEAADALIHAVSIGDAGVIAEAEPELEELGQLLPDHVELLHALAGVALNNDDAERAFELYHRLLNRSPDDPIAHLNLGCLYYQQTGRDAEAHRHLTRYLELEPAGEDRAMVHSILEQLD